MLYLIGAFKLVKVALLIVVGIGLLHFVHRDAAPALERGAELIRIDPQGHYARTAIAKIGGLGATREELLGLGTFAYAAVFATEGIGLIMRRRWAEWFTVIVTGSFVPFEIYEIAKEAHPIRIVLLIANLAIVAYLIWRLKTDD